MSSIAASLHLASLVGGLLVAVETAEFPGYQRSLELVRKELRAHPGLVPLRELLASVHFRAGRFEEAIAEFESAIREHPRIPSLYMGLAAAYTQREDDRRAVATYRRVLALKVPGFEARVRVPLAAALYRLGDFAESVELLRASLEESGPSAEGYYLLARALSARSREISAGDSSDPGGGVEAGRLGAEAVRCFRQAIAIEPAHARAHYGLGRLLLQRGEKERGREHLETFRRLGRGATALTEEALRLSDAKFEAETAVSLARVLFGVSRDAALAQLDHALKIQPSFDRALALRARFYLDMGRREDARRAYEQLLAEHPEHAEGLWNLAMIHLDAGELRLAAPKLLRAAELRRNAAEGWELLYRLAAESGIYADRAEDFAREALRCRPSAKNYGNLGMALFEAGKAAESKRVILQGLEAFPDDADLRTGLQALLELEKKRKD